MFNEMIFKLSKSQKTANLRKQTGASLVEVLVAVVLLTFGILGVAGLQLVGTKTNHGSYLRSQAVSLAYDVADRMRANAAGALANTYNTAAATLYAPGDGPNCGAVVGAVGAAAPAADVNQWKSCLEGALPAGRGRGFRLVAGNDYVDACGVTYANAPRNVFVVEVNWNDGRLQAGANPLDCVVVRTELGPL